MFVRSFTLVLMMVLSVKVQAGTVEASVVVSPVGSFIAEFKDTDGFAYVDGHGFKADSFAIPWSKISTGMSIRDRHTQKYFHADKYPHIEIVQASGQAGKGTAKVRMNGKEKTVKGTYIKDGNNIVAEFPIILSQFDVKDIGFKGATVKDEVKVKVTMPIKAKDAGKK